MELVSIIMPTYNCGRFIRESIDSVLAQTYKGWELIIVDDCSTDNTSEVVGRYIDPRIRYMRNKQNMGAALTRNRALREAKGRYIAFLLVEARETGEADCLHGAERLCLHLP